MRAFVGGVVFAVAVILAVTMFGWVPVVLVLGGFGAGGVVVWIGMYLAFQREVGRWFGW